MPLGMKKDITFLPTFPLPHTCSHTHRHTYMAIEQNPWGPCLPLVYFGVGGDYSLRLYPPFPPPQNVSHLQTQPTLWLGGGWRYFSHSWNILIKICSLPASSFSLCWFSAGCRCGILFVAPGRWAVWTGATYVMGRIWTFKSDHPSSNPIFATY